MVGKQDEKRKKISSKLWFIWEKVQCLGIFYLELYLFTFFFVFFLFSALLLDVCHFENFLKAISGYDFIKFS